MFGINPWIILALGVSHIALAVGGFAFGRSHEAGEQAKVQLEQAVAYAGEIVKAQESADALADDLEAERSRKAAKDRIITKEVVRYEQVVSPADRVVLPAAWRVRHDAAATGEPTGSEAGAVADAGAGPVEDATALEVVADNYEACRGYIDQVIGLQRYVREICAQARRGD